MGPDHYVPFIVLSKVRRWSPIKTVIITILCGFAHILSSVILGFLGIALGLALFELEAIESLRGDLAGWLLIIFGFTYFVWGIHKALRSVSPKHYVESDRITPWILFIIFIFGPCEPLIPLVMYPAAQHELGVILVVVFFFGITTLLTMLGAVLLSYYGLSRLSLYRLERYSHALAGFIILFCGGAIKIFGL